MKIRVCWEIRLWIATVTLFGATGRVDAIEPRAVERLKDATALVLSSGGSGTAFCIHESGLFVTSARSLGTNRSAVLILRSGSVQSVSLNAQAVRVDFDSDVAVLKAGIPANTRLENLGLRPVQVGSSKGLSETMEVVTAGFLPQPVPSAGAVTGTAGNPSPSPTVSVNVGSISGLRKDGDDLEYIQAGSRTSMAIPGGALVGADGRLVGMMISSIPGSGIGFAVPVEKIIPFLSKPVVELTVRDGRLAKGGVFIDRSSRGGTIPSGERHRPWIFEVAMKEVLPLREPAVELALIGAGSGRRVFEPVQEPKQSDGRRLDFFFAAPSIEGSDMGVGRVIAKVQHDAAGTDVKEPMVLVNEPVQFAGREARLADIASITNVQGQTTITSRTGRVIEGSFGGTGEVVVVGVPGERVLDLRSAHLIEIEPEPPYLETVYYEVTITDGRTRRWRYRGEIPIQRDREERGRRGADPAELDLGRQPVVEAEERVELHFERAINEIVPARGGRLLVVRTEAEERVEIVDTVLGEVVASIPVDGAGDRIAANRDKLFVLKPEKRLLERWSLDRFDLERQVAIDGTGELVDICAGAASQSWLYLVETGPLRHFQDLTAYSADGLTPFVSRRLKTSYSDGEFVFRAAAGGMACVFCRSPRGPELHYLSGGEFLAWELPTTWRENLFVGSAGAYAYGLGGPVLLPSLEKLLPGAVARAAATSGIPYLPTEGSGYYFTVQRGGASGNLLKLFPAGDTVACVEVPLGRDGPFEMPGAESGRYVVVGLENRIWVVPGADLVAMIPHGDDKSILIRRLGLGGAGRIQAISEPVRTVRGGSKYLYKIELAGSPGVVQFSLLEGPEGMEVSAGGEVNWVVPQAIPLGAELPVRVGFEGTDGRSGMQQYTVRIR